MTFTRPWLAERNRARATHGATRDRSATPEYLTWRSIKKRCLNLAHQDYPNYGGRGIRVHVPWQASFLAFLSAVGPRPPGTTLDRIDSNGHYEPGNVRWADSTQQGRNRRNNVRIEINGEVKCLTEWCEITGVTRSAAYQRIERGWNPVAAVTSFLGSK